MSRFNLDIRGPLRFSLNFLMYNTDMEKIKIRWKAGAVFLAILFGVIFNLGGSNSLFWGDSNLWSMTLSLVLDVALPICFLTAVFLFSLYHAEKSIIKKTSLKLRAVLTILNFIIFGVSVYVLTSFTEIIYRWLDPFVVMGLGGFLIFIFWVAFLALSLIISIVSSLFLRSFYQNAKVLKITFFVFVAVFVLLLAYYPVNLSTCNMGMDYQCMLDKAIKVGDVSFCDNRKSEQKRKLCELEFEIAKQEAMDLSSDAGNETDVQR